MKIFEEHLDIAETFGYYQLLYQQTFENERERAKASDEFYNWLFNQYSSLWGDICKLNKIIESSEDSLLRCQLYECRGSLMKVAVCWQEGLNRIAYQDLERNLKE